MSGTKKYAESCRNQLAQDNQTLIELTEIQAQLEADFQKQGSLVVQADFDAIDKKIEAQQAVIDEGNRRLEAAVAALAAENKLEEEMRKAAEKDMGL